MYWKRSEARGLTDRPTEELDKMLDKVSPGRVSGFIADNLQYLSGTDKGFYYYYKDVLDEKRIRLKDVYAQMGISETYGSKIISMEKHTKNRDLIIRFCLAGHFNLVEINRALKLYGFAELYSKIPRDACLIVSVNNRIYDVEKINGILSENGQDGLTV